MSTPLNRRNWLRSSLMMVGGLTMLPEVLAHQSTHSTPLSIADVNKLRAKLNANENPYGPSDKVKEAISKSLFSGNRYPMDGLQQLTAKIAEKEKVTPEHIIIGAGSTELLVLAGLSYGLEGGNLLTSELTYDTIMGHAKKFNAKIVQVPLTSGYSYDLEKMSQSLTRKNALVYICNPNNPTGTKVDPASLRNFIEDACNYSPVFVDEAYNEFLENAESESMIDLVRKDKPVIIARTFSKIHGLAGLRIGYLVGPPATLEKMRNYHQRVPNISALSVYAALASMQDGDFHRFSQEKNTEVRNWLYGEFDKMNQEYIPSVTSFTLFPIQLETQAFQQEMLNQGIGIRTWQFAGRNWCRVSMGTPEEMEIFMNGLKSIVKA